MEKENEIVKREGQSFIERLIENTDSLDQVREVGMVIIKSGFCPEHFKQSQDAVGAIMCIEAGRKLGLSWMQSLSDIYPVKGRIGIMGTAAKAVIFASGVLESWKEYTEGEWPNPNYKHVTISKRKNLPDEFRTEFSVFDAQTAGLMQKDIYKKYGKRMIAWRDIGFHASDYYQDILKGMKTVEELNDYDGLVPGTPEKVTLKTEDGKEITFSDQDKEHSKKSTSRVASKIPDNKFGNVTDVQPITQEVLQPIVKNESNPPEKEEASLFVPSKGSVEVLDGNVIEREVKPGQHTLAEMEKMDVKELLAIINDDMDMMEAMETVPGKNTNKKLRLIIDAAQNGQLTEYVGDQLEAEPPETKKVLVENEHIVGDIPMNKDFDKQSPKHDNFLDGPVKEEKPKEEKTTEAGNKYGIEIPEETPRDFSIVKALFNKMMGIDPQITSVRYIDLATKAGLIADYKDKESFIRDASISEINTLLDSN